MNKPTYNPSIEQKVTELKLISREIKRLEKLETDIKSQICSQLTEAYDAMGHIIATYTNQNREVFDKSRFTDEHPGIYEQYVKLTQYKVFRLK